MKKSYSQLSQDINIIKFYNEKKNGYFVDIGAHNGISLSNTYLLEKKYDWKGICAEPLKSAYSELVKNRDAICCNDAIYSVSNKTLDFSECKMYSGITEHIDCPRRLHTYKKAKTNTITLTDLLDKHNAPKFIEYMSLDTEGSELEILKGTDFSKYTFGYISIEHNYQQPRRSQMRKLLEKNGYVFKCQNQFDDDYVHKSLSNG